MFESVEEVDQIEVESKSEEAKQVPKVPNGALQNETSSPDSGHPSSRNFSVTSGLSDGSFSTEDSAAPDATPRAAPQASQSSAKPAEGDGEATTTESQATNDKGKAEEEKTFVVSKSAETASTAAISGKMDKEGAHLLPEPPENIELETSSLLNENTKQTKTSKSSKTGKDGADETTSTVTAAAAHSKEPVQQSPHEKVVVNVKEAPEPEEKKVQTVKEVDESKTSSEVSQETFTGHKAPEEEKSLACSAGARVLRAGGVHAQKEEFQATANSDESPSTIDMEEVLKANVSMAPWGRKRHCETSTFPEDPRSHVELRQEEKLSPEGTESTSELEMESLYPPMVADENTKIEESSGNPYSVRTLFF